MRPQNRPFRFVWKRGHYSALIVKIRSIYTSSNGHQRPLNRGCFQHIVYPVWTPERLPEREYEGRFFPTKVKPSWKNGNYSILTEFIQTPRHPYPIIHPTPDHKCRPIPTHLTEIQKTGTSSRTPGPPSRGPVKTCQQSVIAKLIERTESAQKPANSFIAYNIQYTVWQ